MYRVSVIMPVYNNKETLKRAIEAVLSQTVYGLELILVDDGSTDGSAQICDYYAKKEPLLVEVIHQERKGFGQARNKGLLHSSGKYIYFANATDVIHGKLLKDNYKLAEEKEAELVVFGFTECNDKYLEGKLERFPRLPDLSTQEMFRQHYRNFHHFYPYALHNKLYRREYLKENRIRFQNIPLKEDAFFNLSVYKELNTVAFNRLSYCEHHVQNQKSVEDFYKINLKLANAFETMIKYWNYDTEFHDLIVREYYEVVYAELQNISVKGNGLSTAAQEERINAILVDETVSAFLGNLKPAKEKNPHMRTILVALQKANGKAAIQLVTHKNDHEKITSKVSRFLRKLFRH